MASARTQRAATVGVGEHGNSAVLVTVAPDGEILDRRRIDLTDRDLPTDGFGRRTFGIASGSDERRRRCPTALPSER